jgi:enoyl-CoA hydratase
MSFQCIKVDVDDYIAVVTMDRPPVNAQNAQFREEIIEAFDSFNDRDDVRVAILTGAGKVFCAGADIKERIALVKKPGDYWRHNRGAREYSNAIRASDNATFGMPEIDVGLAGGCAFISRLFSKSRGRRIVFTGERFSAAELYRLGVIEWCGPREQLMEEAMKIARNIASKSPLAMILAKEAYNVCENMPQRDGYRFEQNITERLSHTEDAREAQRAFAEKRKPVFKGR